ncbi:alginate lyase family protein [Pedobacter lusitanus]|uniref:alginate lyase family protein n=1 Tax=Pedobacter lusitanus TaxID=1503925 RepID=UPI000698FFBE|nr:alginate lyase family protein [Pedobacter lusitanus]
MKKLIYSAVIGLAVCATGCKKEAAHENGIPDQSAKTQGIGDTLTYSKNLVFSAAGLNKISTDLAGTNQVQIQKLITNTAYAALTKTTNTTAVGTQGTELKCLALQWAVSPGRDTASKYLDKAKTNLLAWAAVNTPSSSTPTEAAFIEIFEAYSIIRANVPDASKTTIDAWLKKTANYYITNASGYTSRKNNWETIRLNLLYDIGYILNDATILTHVKKAYTTQLNVNLFAGGKTEDYVNRDAFAYHAYNLYFYARVLRAVSLYEGPAAGTDLLNKTNTINVSIPNTMTFWEPYMLDPANNIHLEFVNTGWAPDKTRSDYNKPYKPSSTVYVLDQLAYSFPQVVDYEKVIVGATTTRFRTLEYYLNTLEYNL